MHDIDLPEDFTANLIDFENLTQENLLSQELYAELFSVQDEFTRTELESKCSVAAKKYKITNEFRNNYKQYKIREVRQRKAVGGRFTTFSNAPLSLNCADWMADDYGVKKNEINASGMFYTKTACPHPILPTEILTNLDTDTEKLKLSFFKNGCWDSVICDRSTTASNNKIVDLSNRGVEVTSETSKHLVSYIADCVALNEGVLPRYKAIGRLGWVKDEFMPYDKQVRFDGEKENHYLYDRVSQRGDLQDWIDYTRDLRKNKLLRLQMAASFASPIIERVNALPFVLHYWGGPLQSGSGKTVGLMVAASIWGDPALGGLVRTMDSTQNATMSIAGFLHNVPYFGDELQLIKDKWGNYDKLVMKVCEGADRGRMSYDKILPTKTWKCAFLFTGEESIVKKESGAGVFSRVIEIECKEMVVENGNAVVNFILENYGLAGEVFVNKIKKEDLQAQYNMLFKYIIDNTDTNEKQAASMALILLGDRLAEKYIYTSNNELSLDDVRQYLFTKSEIDVCKRAYDWMHNWIARNEIRFIKGDENRGELWGKIEKDYAMINKDVLSEHMSQMGIELSAVIGKLADRGLIVKDSMGKNTHGTFVHGVKARYVKLRLDMSETIAQSELPIEFR